MSTIETIFTVWAKQKYVVLSSVPCNTVAQRKVYWKVSRRLDKKIKGRAYRTALKLFMLDDKARARRWVQEQQGASV